MNKVEKSGRTSRFQRAIAAVSVMAVTAMAGWCVWSLPPFPNRMHDLVHSRLSISGVENPVTAVLLNFRGYDTLLEIAVLLLAAVGVFAMMPAPVQTAESPPSPIQILLLRRLLPFIILVAGYVLWIGKYAPGGAFQAGAVLAAGGVLAVISAVRFNRKIFKSIPIGLSIGLLTFLAVALATMINSGNLLQYPVAKAGTLILLIEAAATISIAVILTILFIGGMPAEEHSLGEK
jgi:multisubunit Na+/H+ antiporter MnhB subunit